jgi:hypothetical protein
MVAYSLVKEDMKDPAQSLGGVRPAGFTLGPTDKSVKAAAPQPFQGLNFAVPPLLPTKAAHQERQQKGPTLFNISTPSGMTKVHLNEKELLYQERGFRAATTRMNAGHFLGVGGYLEQFGTIDPHTNYGWGSDIWSGIVKLLGNYTHADKLHGQLFLGWFIIPVPFGKINSLLHPQGDQTPSPGYFPAVCAFDQRYPDADITMACLHILLEGGPAWVVHSKRIIFVKAL